MLRACFGNVSAAVRGLQELSAASQPVTASSCVQKRFHRGVQWPRKKLTTNYKQHYWFNRGAFADQRNFAALRDHVHKRSGAFHRRGEHGGHIAWGPFAPIPWTNVTCMRKEIEEKVGEPHTQTPPVIHGNARKIVADDFDFDRALAEPGRFQPKKGYYYDAREDVVAWDRRELERLRGNKWHLKYYHGSFRLM
eukprot:Sspe_Gene.34877::Locus_16939_Transcript_1_1_Confidence_1.000_Length_700::g.34877::m.34877